MEEIVCEVVFFYFYFEPSDDVVYLLVFGFTSDVAKLGDESKIIILS